MPLNEGYSPRNRAERVIATAKVIDVDQAVGAARSGNPGAAKQDVARLGELRAKLADAKDEYWAQQVEIRQMAAQAWRGSRSPRAAATKPCSR